MTIRPWTAIGSLDCDEGRLVMETGGNVDRLQAEGLIAKGDLPPEVRSVIEGLTGDEVDILVSVKRRLDSADIPEDYVRPEPRPKSAWEVWMVF